MRREAEGCAPELVGSVDRPEFYAKNRQYFSLNETLGLDITVFGGSVKGLYPLIWFGIPKTELYGDMQVRTTRQIRQLPLNENICSILTKIIVSSRRNAQR